MSDLPLQHLARLLHDHPTLPRQVDDLLRGKGSRLPDWPAWCLLPMAGWLAIAQGPHELTLDHVRAGQRLCALGTWRYTKGIYRYDPEVYAALIDTPLAGDLPASLLLRLPEWSVYIETPGLAIYGVAVDGFWATLDYDIECGDAQLRTVMAIGDQTHASPTITLGRGSLADAIERTYAGSEDVVTYLGDDVRPHAERDAAQMMPFVSLLLYLCTDEPEIDDVRQPGSSPGNPRPKRVKHGWRLFAPDRARIWTVGAQIGKAIREGREHEPTGRTVRPHIRRGHWHGYWYGPRTGERVMRVKWLPPIAVAAGED